MKERNALFSSWLKPEDMFILAQELFAQGWGIYASGGTCRKLNEDGVEAIDVATLIGGQEILGHKVVTLSREVHASLLAFLNDSGDMATLEKLGLPVINLVYCDFYPLTEAISKKGATLQDVIDATDIGGPTMIRSAAKGGRITLCDPRQIDEARMVLQKYEYQIDNLPVDYLQFLRANAEAYVANYVGSSAEYHSDGTMMSLGVLKEFYQVYGENRYQSPGKVFAMSGFENDVLSWKKWEFNQEFGYVNLTGGDRALDLMCLLASSFESSQNRFPFIAIVCKHGSPCGVGVDMEFPVIAIHKALRGDPVAAMGGELMLNFMVTEKEVSAILDVPEDFQGIAGRKKWGMDVIFCAGVDKDIRDQLEKQGDRQRKIAINPEMILPVLPQHEFIYKFIRGGVVRQKYPDFQITDLRSDVSMDQIIAWAVAWRTKSNSIAIAKDGLLLAQGSGQQDRRACVRLCLEKAKLAGHDLNASYFASDGFFPFAVSKDDNKEGTELLVEAGCLGGAVPADGKRLEEVKEFFAEYGLDMTYIPKEFRGFYDH